MLPVWSDDVILRDIFYVAFAIWCILELIGFFTQRPPKDATVIDRRSRVALLRGIWLGILLDFNVSGRLPGAAIPWARLPLFWAGIALLLGGTAFRWYAIRVLGQYFTRDVVVRPGQQVIQSGPYRLIRHPSYSGGLLSMLGLGLALGNWAGMVLLVGLVLAVYIYRMGVEEQALLQGIGEPYRGYMSRTRRLIPFVY